MTFTGMKSALDKGPAPGSPLFVFTDAPPKDNTRDLVEEVSSQAWGGEVQMFTFFSQQPLVVLTSHSRNLPNRPVAKCLNYPRVALNLPK